MAHVSVETVWSDLSPEAPRPWSRAICGHSSWLERSRQVGQRSKKGFSERSAGGLHDRL